MLMILCKFICGIIPSISGFVFIKNIIRSDVKFFSLKTIVLILLLGSVTPLTYTIRFQILNPIIPFFSSLIFYSFIFKKNIKDILILSFFLFTFVFVGDFIFSIVFSRFLTIEQIRGDYIIMIISNLINGLICVFFSTVAFIKKWINHLILTKINRNFKIIFFFIICMFGFSCILYLISKYYFFNYELIISFIVMGIFFLLVIMYIREQLEFNNLLLQISSLMNITNQFEEWMEKDKINRHELKNSIVILKTMISDKEIMDFIDEKFSNKAFDYFDYDLLKGIPNGLKGLVFYKILESKKLGVDFDVFISKELVDSTIKIDIEDFQDLSYIFGIFLDNAIESASMSDNKKVLFEMYLINKNIIKIVISNTYSGTIDLKKLFKKGYTTKGSFHGNGLYLANKIINKNENITCKTKIISSYFIHEVTYVPK